MIVRSLGLIFVNLMSTLLTGIDSSEYYAMCKSVEKYNGFYIARFEAGDSDVDIKRTEETEAHQVVSKKGAVVYNYVPWSGGQIYSNNGKNSHSFPDDCAVGLSRNMYKESTSVVSTLCYGVQWDATMNFVSDTEHNIVDSSLWGNFESKQLSGSSEIWKAKNIYDLAGNFAEFTMELADDYAPDWLMSGHSFGRGAASASDRGHEYGEPMGFASASASIGFRVALYLK